MEISKEDLKFMEVAIKIAKKGCLRTPPNPMVGAVITDGKEILSKGYHKYFGGPHAEIVALRKLPKTKKELNLYVNLEPCVHYGKTGPCVDEIIKSKIKNVFISTKDPNPLVNGKGIEKLKNSGINVFLRILEEEAIFLNRIFYYNQIYNLPYLILKSASTLDGYIADENYKSKWITSKEAREIGKKLREEVDGILVGVNTVLRDNPKLDRIKENPPRAEIFKIILDPEGKISKDFNLFKKGKVIWVLKEGIKKETPKNTIVLNYPLVNGTFPLKNLLKKLKEIGVNSILIEGGSKTSSFFLKENLVQEVAFFYSPKILGGGIKNIYNLNLSLDKAIKVQNIKLKKIGEDFYLRGFLCSLELLKRQLR